MLFGFVCFFKDRMIVGQKIILKEVSRGPVPDPLARSLEVQYRTPSQSYEDCLGVREYITMDIYWMISLYFREILFCEYEFFENDLKF